MIMLTQSFEEGLMEEWINQAVYERELKQLFMCF